MTEAIITKELEKTVIRPTGDVVAAYISELRSAIRDSVRDGARDVTVDLSNTKMVDSSGLGLLISAHNSLQRVGGRLTVIHASIDILHLFQTMRMHQHFTICGD